tara:strand:+ start:357 stop:698 length:342 start_codon:yes stop_codon:yes gene_type:complete
MNVVAVVMACLAMLVYASAPAKHAPDLHVSASSIGPIHGHGHGDNSHDAVDTVGADAADGSHHHADHTHDTAGLVGTTGVSASQGRQLKRLMLSLPLFGGLPFEIERPPRFLT